MSIEVTVPNLPESVAEATVIAWHKKAGDRVSRDENLADLETDKVVLEVPSPVDGVLERIFKRDGATVTAGEVLAVVGPRGHADELAAPAPESAAEVSAASIPSAPPEALSLEPSPSPLSPSVRRLLMEHQIEAEAIEGTGKAGRITREDVQAYLASQAVAETAPERPAPAAARGEQEEAVESCAPELPDDERGARPERRVPMTRIRARIAERLLQAQQNAAILTTFNEVNLHRTNELRQRYRESFEKRHAVRLGLMSFFVKACVEALKQFPIVNASVSGQDIVYHGYFDIGIAVSSPRGLVVPILRDSDQMDFAEIEKTIGDFAHRAQEGKLTMEELSGGTFSISNGGVFGSMLSTPILNPPQSAILGMHAIQQRPVAEAGQVVIRPMMYLALSYDHRIIDGADAVRFLVTIKERLEDPARLLLGV